MVLLFQASGSGRLPVVFQRRSYSGLKIAPLTKPMFNEASGLSLHLRMMLFRRQTIRVGRVNAKRLQR